MRLVAVALMCAAMRVARPGIADERILGIRARRADGQV